MKFTNGFLFFGKYKREIPPSRVYKSTTDRAEKVKLTCYGTINEKTTELLLKLILGFIPRMFLNRPMEIDSFNQ